MKPFSHLIPVPNDTEGLTWYQKDFPLAQSHYLAEFEFTLLIIEDFQIEIVQADEKVNAGSASVVFYWFTDNLNKSIQHLESLGATLYRGPLAIKNGLSMCQMKDPLAT